MLSLPHDPEVPVGNEVEDLQDMVEQLGMLPGEGGPDFDLFGPALERLHDRGELDPLRPGPDHDEDSRSIAHRLARTSEFGRHSIMQVLPRSRARVQVIVAWRRAGRDREAWPGSGIAVESLRAP